MKKYMFYLLTIQIISLPTLINCSSHNQDEDESYDYVPTARSSKKQQKIQSMIAEAQQLEAQQTKGATSDTYDQAHNNTQMRMSSSAAAAAASSTHQEKEQLHEVSAEQLEELNQGLVQVAQQVNDFQDRMEERLQEQERLLAEIRELLLAQALEQDPEAKF